MSTTPFTPRRARRMSPHMIGVMEELATLAAAYPESVHADFWVTLDTLRAEAFDRLRAA